MSSSSDFLIEFPADRDYVPFIQNFLKDFLNNFDYDTEFSELAAAEAFSWFNSIIPEEKHLQALPTISFSGTSLEQGLEVQIQTTDDHVFRAYLNPQKPRNKK
ncbi:MAG: hypothetical protein FWC26_12485 [Fibromonadales bacterium]|nr:hypothetical protein [Fibromonadales bacterium]